MWKIGALLALLNFSTYGANVAITIQVERAEDKSMTIAVKSTQSGFVRLLTQNSGGTLSVTGDLIPVSAGKYANVTAGKKPLVLPPPMDESSGAGGSGPWIGAMHFKSAEEAKGFAAKNAQRGLSPEEVVKLHGAVTRIDGK